MKLNGVHFILTYTCLYECDHCFLYCGPGSKGTFTLSQISMVLDEIKKMEGITSVSFEGGEPFLTFPLLQQAILKSKEQGLKTAIETNSFWATSVENALLWLEPLKEAGLDLIETSDDAYHFGTADISPASYAQIAADKLGLECQTICIDDPTASTLSKIEKGKPVYQGKPKSRGRAADILTRDVPSRSPKTFMECPFEDLSDPGRVHIDPFGNIHLCQGISIGNFWQEPLSEIVASYIPEKHPICGPLIQGGPYELAKTHNLSIKDKCVDECHYCTKACIALMGKYPEYITPTSVFGIDGVE